MRATMIVMGCAWLAAVGQAMAAPATMNDFWEHKAAFEYDSKFMSAGVYWFNTNNEIVVKDDVWYLFGKYLVDTGTHVVPSCGVVREVTKLTVRESRDHGQTWGPNVVVAGDVAGPDGCEAAEPAAYFDAETRTWQLLYQCVSTGGSPWNMCHASLHAESPLAKFVSDPANPVVHNGEIWSIVYPGQGMVDEGTPEILQKSDGYYYVTFHGYQNPLPIHLSRGIARTRDFNHWEAVNQAPTYSASDCTRWYNHWKGACYGGGYATIQHVAGGGGCGGDWNYMLMESSDTDGQCHDNQTWAMGLLRSPSLTARTGTWQTDLTRGILFSTREQYVDGTTNGCGVHYQKLFHDENGIQRLVVDRGGTDKFPPTVSQYVYSLNLGAPMVHYAFREGDWGNGRHYTQSDTVSSGNLEAEVVGATTTTSQDGSRWAVALSDTLPSAVQPVEDAAAFNVDGDFTLRVHARLDALPATGSALFAGRRDAYWMELHPDGRLCARVRARSNGAVTAACVSASAHLRRWHTFTAQLSKGVLSMRVDARVPATAPFGGVPAVGTTRFTVGARAAVSGGLYGGFKGLVDDVALYNRGDVLPPPDVAWLPSVLTLLR